jgi:translation initiation factor 1A
MGVGDIILISLRDYQEGRADIILKYNADEARSLKSLGEIPDTAVINENDGPHITNPKKEFIRGFYAS